MANYSRTERVSFWWYLIFLLLPTWAFVFIPSNLSWVTREVDKALVSIFFDVWRILFKWSVREGLWIFLEELISWFVEEVISWPPVEEIICFSVGSISCFEVISCFGEEVIISSAERDAGWFVEDAIRPVVEVMSWFVEDVNWAAVEAISWWLMLCWEADLTSGKKLFSPSYIRRINWVGSRLPGCELFFI